MLTAISCGVTAPRSRPIGAWMRSSSAGSTFDFGQQLVVEPRHLGAAANQADVAQVARRERAQRVEIVAMTARHDHRVGGRGNLRLREPGGMSSTTTDAANGKRSVFANAARSSMTCTPKPASCAILAEVVADVAGAEDVDGGRGFDRLDEHFHLPAADQPGLFREVVVEIVFDGGRLARLQAPACALPIASCS